MIIHHADASAFIPIWAPGAVVQYGPDPDPLCDPGWAIVSGAAQCNPDVRFLIFTEHPLGFPQLNTNVVLGVSVTTQDSVDRACSTLLDSSASRRGLLFPCLDFPAKLPDQHVVDLVMVYCDPTCRLSWIQALADQALSRAAAFCLASADVCQDCKGESTESRGYACGHTCRGGQIGELISFPELHVPGHDTRAWDQLPPIGDRT